MEKDVNYYISKGMDKKMAEYYASGLRTATGVSANKDYTILITYDNGEKRLYDMNPLLETGTVFEKIMDWSSFSNAHINDNDCVAWNADIAGGEIDISPDVCYVEGTPVN